MQICANARGLSEQHIPSDAVLLPSGTPNSVMDMVHILWSMSTLLLLYSWYVILLFILDIYIYTSFT